jgi:PEP-CTERM motif
MNIGLTSAVSDKVGMLVESQHIHRFTSRIRCDSRSIIFLGGFKMLSLKKMLSRAAIGALAIGMASSAMAATITYTLSGTGSATIGNVVQNGPFVATGIGDTANVGFPFGSGVPTVPLSSFTVAFGSTVYTASNPIRFFVNNNLLIAGFNDTTTQDVLNFSSGVFMIYNGVSNTFIATTGGFTSVLATNAGPLRWNGGSIGGILDFRAVVGAAAVPEPATWAMMLTGFGIVGTALRRRQRVSVSFG